MDELTDMDCFDVLENLLTDPLVEENKKEEKSLGKCSFPSARNDNQSEEASKEATPTLIQITPSGSTSGGRTRTPFPKKLHKMVTESNLDSVISWLPHGRGFMVYDVDEFAAEILPKYFNHSKFASFQRQLNCYGFRRFSQGRDAGAYYHEFFLRGRPNLCSRISRLKQKLDPLPTSSEVDFYALPFIDIQGKETISNPQLPLNISTSFPNLPKQKSRTFCKMEGSDKTTKNNGAPLPTTSSKDFARAVKTVKRSAVSIDGNAIKVVSKCFSSKENSGKSLHPPLDNGKKMPINKWPSILPMTNHPLDQVDFFIPLDMLMNSCK